MAFTWGSQSLNVVPGTYSPSYANNSLTLIDIIPGSTGSAKQILQQGGVKRETVEFDGFVLSKSEYDTLLADYHALTERTYTDPYISETMLIYYLSEPIEVVPGVKYEYSISLLEV